MLLLQIHAAADYFTLNKTLMSVVPPVRVDVILDRYLMNVFPQSLLPTAMYITVLAVIGWFVSGYVWRLLVSFVEADRAMINQKSQ